MKNGQGSTMVNGEGVITSNGLNKSNKGEIESKQLEKSTSSDDEDDDVRLMNKIR